MSSACPKTPITTIFSTKSMTLKFAKKLPTLGMHYNAKPDSEPTLPEDQLPDLPDPRNRHITTERLAWKQ